MESNLLKKKKKKYTQFNQFLLWISKEMLYSVQKCGDSWRTKAKNKNLQLFTVWDGTRERRLGRSG